MTGLPASTMHGGQTDILLLDFSKAFDKVSHAYLAVKLKYYGITEKSLERIQSFLRDRKQHVSTLRLVRCLLRSSTGLSHRPNPVSSLNKWHCWPDPINRKTDTPYWCPSHNPQSMQPNHSLISKKKIHTLSVFRSTGPIAVVRRRSVCLSTSVTFEFKKNNFQFKYFLKFIFSKYVRESGSGVSGRRMLEVVGWLRGCQWEPVWVISALRERAHRPVGNRES